MPAAQPTLRSTLRARTSDIHRQLEAFWTPQGGFGTLPRYKAFLEAILNVHSTIGLAAAQARGEGIEDERERIAALSKDLDFDPRPPSESTMDREYAWGVGYVLNGSTMGASILLKSGEIASDWPSRYMEIGRDYASDGRLNEFLLHLNHVRCDPPRVLKGAMATFAMLGKDCER